MYFIYLKLLAQIIIKDQKKLAYYFSTGNSTFSKENKNNNFLNFTSVNLHQHYSIEQTN